jgi:hypothetical protein
MRANSVELRTDGTVRLRGGFIYERTFEVRAIERASIQSHVPGTLPSPTIRTNSWRGAVGLRNAPTRGLPQIAARFASDAARAAGTCQAVAHDAKAPPGG